MLTNAITDSNPDHDLKQIVNSKQFEIVNYIKTYRQFNCMHFKLLQKSARKS